MKYCPKCRSTFTNDELNFCLQDGMQLLTLTDESASQNFNTNFSTDAKTLQMSQTQTEELIDEETREHKSRATQEPFYQQPQPRKGGNIILTLGVIVIALCLVALVGIGAIFIAKDFVFANQNNSNTPNTNNSNSSSSNTNNSNNSNNTNNTSNQNTTLPIPTGIKATASSTRAPYKDIPYSPSFIIDGNLTTAWIEGGSGEGIGEWVRCDFGKTVMLKKIVVYPGYFKNESIWAKNNRVASATLYFSDGSSIEFDFEDVMKPQTIDIGIKTDYVKLVIEDVFVGESDIEDTAISEINFVFE